MGRSSGRRWRALFSATAVTVISGTLTGLGAESAEADSTALSVGTIGVYIGSGTHSEPITIPSASSIVGTSEPIVVYGLGNASLVVGVSAGSSTHASCAKGSTEEISDYSWTCTPSSTGWSAGELYFAVNIPEKLPASMSDCANGGCAITTSAAWENGPDTIRAEGLVNILVPKTAAPATSSSTKHAPSSTVSTAAGSAARSASAGPSRSASASPSLSTAGSASPSPAVSTHVVEESPATPFSVPGKYVAISRPYRSHGFWPVALAVPTLAGFGFAIGTFAARRRRTAGSDD